MVVFCIKKYRFLAYFRLLYYLCTKFYIMYTIRVKPKNILHLIWLEKEDDDITKHEYFSYASALFEKYSPKVLGFSKTRLNNAFSELEKAGKPAVFIPRGGKVKIIKGVLIDKKKVSSKENED